MTAININHKEGTITTDNDQVLQITKNGAVKIGDGNYLEELNVPEYESPNEEYKGVIRYNPTTKCLQYCDGFHWKDFSYDVDETPGIIWSLTF